jgi:hypothetical protein
MNSQPKDEITLRELSFLTYGIERCFFYLQYLSLANILFQTRTTNQDRFATKEIIRTVTRRRSNQIELYAIGWLIVEIGLVAWSPRAGVCAHRAIDVFATYRIFDVLQVAINIALFDRLRRGDKPHYVAVLVRMLVLSLWNFFELALCFGILYSNHLSLLKSAASTGDAYYFSMITQLTIGYGDINPTSYLKAVAMTQGAVGFFFGILVLSRFVGLLPKLQPVYGDD